MSPREKQMMRNADVNLRIRYNVHKAKEPYTHWPKSRRVSHDRFCSAMNIPSYSEVTAA